MAKVMQNGKTIIMVQYIHKLNTLRSTLREERLMWKIRQSRTSYWSSAVGVKIALYCRQVVRHPPYCLQTPPAEYRAKYDAIYIALRRWWRGAENDVSVAGS